MIDQATELPDPLLLDVSKLHRFPSAAGLLHCEVLGMKDTIALKIGAWAEGFLGWKVKVREIPKDAPVHPTVGERFRLSAAPRSSGVGPYRPEALRNHSEFQSYY